MVRTTRKANEFHAASRGVPNSSAFFASISAAATLGANAEDRTARTTCTSHRATSFRSSPDVLWQVTEPHARKPPPSLSALPRTFVCASATRRKINVTRVQLRSALNLNVQASFAIAALAIALPLPAFAYTGEKLERYVNVSAARAKAAALKKEPGTIVGMELEKEKGGTGIRYTFTISIRGIKHEVGIDANTGVVLEDILEGKNPD